MLTGMKISSCRDWSVQGFTGCHESQQGESKPAGVNGKEISDFVISTSAPAVSARHWFTRNADWEPVSELTHIGGIFGNLFACPGYLNQGHILK